MEEWSGHEPDEDYGNRDTERPPATGDFDSSSIKALECIGHGRTDLANGFHVLTNRELTFRLENPPRRFGAFVGFRVDHTMVYSLFGTHVECMDPGSFPDLFDEVGFHLAPLVRV